MWDCVYASKCYTSILPDKITDDMKHKAIVILIKKVFIFSKNQVGRFESLKMVVLSLIIL